MRNSFINKILITLFALLGLSTLSNAQIVNIPDANFKAVLVNNPNINTNADTQIQISEAHQRQPCVLIRH